MKRGHSEGALWGGGCWGHSEEGGHSEGGIMKRRPSVGEHCEGGHLVRGGGGILWAL